MSEEQTVEEIKERLKVEIPIEEEDVADSKADDGDVDVVAELSNLGRQVAETLRSAWDSEERQKLEGEVRQGVQSFVDEMDKVIRDVRGGNFGKEKIKADMDGMREQVNSGDFGRKMRTGIVQGLRWLSDEIGTLADQFTAPEKSPDPETTDESA